MSDVLTNGFFRGVEISFLIWVVFHGSAYVINTARDFFGTP